MGVPVKQSGLMKFDELWNQGRFREARQLLYDMRNGRNERHDAAYWSKLAMAEIRHNQLEEAECCMEEVRACRDYDKTFHERAYLRNLAAWFARRPRGRKTPGVILQYVTNENSVLGDLLFPALNSEDPSDKAAAYMMLGRWFSSRAEHKYADGRRLNLAQALFYFEQADAIWESIPEKANGQCRINNRFHWYLTLRAHTAMRGVTLDPSKLSELYTMVVNQDPNRKRVLLVHFVHYNRAMGLFISRRLKK